MRSEYLTHIFEAMNALISANNMPGIQDTGNNVYIVNKLQNNAFTWGMTTDYKMRHMIEKDPEDKKLKLKDVDNQDNYGFDSSTKIDSVWTITDKAGLSEAIEKIYENLGNEVDDNFIYETLTGEKMYTLDQIEFSDKVKKITPLDDMIKGMCESIRNYTLYGKEKAELLAEVKYGDKSVSEIMNEYKDTLLEESVNFRRAEQDDDSVLQEKEDLSRTSIIESEDMSTIDNNHTRGEQYKYKAIDLYNDECYNYFDKKEIDYYRNGNRQGEILVETDYKSTIGYIYVREIKEGNLAGNAVGPFKVFPDYRGKGYGEILLRDAINKYKANILGVYVDNQVAIVLYKKVGFKIVKEMTDKKGEKFYIMKI